MEIYYCGVMKPSISWLKKMVSDMWGIRDDFKYKTPTVMVWGCFSTPGTGPIERNEGKIYFFMYKDILGK